MPRKVLIAHGDTEVLDRVVRELTVAGFAVIATPDGGDAFARFFEEKPDLVICSEALPVLDGRSFCRMIQSQEPDTPVVLLVAKGVQQDVDGILVLPEPLEIAELRRLLPDIIGQPHATAVEPAPATGESPDEVHGLILGFQRQGNLLALVDRAGLERLAALAALQEREGGACVIAEGEPCDGFYLVVDGEVRVTIAERGDQEVARLGSGEFFGEMALLSEQPRSASVWTCGPTRLLFFEREAVLGLLEDYPELREVLGGVAVQRAEENLWQALANDDEVQHSLSELLDGVVESPAGGRPSVAKTEPAVPQVSDEAGTPPPSVSEPAGGRHRREQAIVRWAASHRFEAGLMLGAIGGTLLAGAFMLAFGGGAEELPMAPAEVPQEVARAEEPVEGEEPTGVAVAPDGGDAAALDTTAELDEAARLDEQPAADADQSAETELRVGAPPSQQEIERPIPGRKALRKSMFAAYERGDFSEAAAVGGQLREQYALDWEAYFTIAQAHRRAGDASAALAEYLAFAEAYPDNVYADDAQFWAAEILAERGQRREAAELYRAVIANPKTNLKARATKRLSAVTR